MTASAPLSDQTDPTGGDLRRRLIAARSLAELGGARLSTPARTALRTVLERARGRLAVAGDHTVVVLAGPTGVGKSSLFNAVLDVDLATVGVTRPTTSEPLAAVVSAEPVAELMGHLGLSSWNNVAVHTHPELESLVLVDLPDHDSVVVAHRHRAAEVVAVADRLVWVVDPEKYADASVHDDLLGPLRAHSGVLTVVCNRMDRLRPDEAEQVVADLRTLLADAGLAGTEVLAVSTVADDGIDALRDRLAASVADHRAAGDRIVADLRALAAELSDEVPPDAGGERTRRHEAIVEAAMTAAGAPAVLDAVSATHRHRARRATGWPPLRRLQAPGRDPLARLGLARDRPVGGVGTRSSRAVPHGVATATLATAIRTRVDDLAAGWPARWAAPLEDRLDGVVADLPVALDRAVAATDLEDDHHPRWWVAVGALQWLLAAAMVAGALWLTAAFVVVWMQLPDLPTADLSLGTWSLPWPTVLLIGGGLLGLGVGTLAGTIAGTGAARARRRVRRRLHERVEAVVEDVVVDVLEAEGARAAAARDHLARMGA